MRKIDKDYLFIQIIILKVKMGIGFHVQNYNCECRWSYTGFNRFRKKIARSLGLILEIDSEFKLIEQDWNKWDKDWLIFLTHSDCDGFFSPYRCGRISKKLKIVLENFNIHDFTDEYDLEHGNKLVKAMEYCFEHKKVMRIS